MTLSEADAPDRTEETEGVLPEESGALTDPEFSERQAENITEGKELTSGAETEEDASSGTKAGEPSEAGTAGTAEPGGPLVIELDPGHGGDQSGAVNHSTGTREKDVNLKIALYLRDALQEYDQVQVYMTREDDSELGIEARVNKSVDDGADVLISLHNNAYGSIVDYDHGSTVLVQRGALHEENSLISQELGCYILYELSSLGLEDQGLMFRLSQSGEIYSNGELCDYYGIIRYAEMAALPAIIVEHAFMDSASDFEEYLSDDEKIQSLAEADARGIVSYYGLDADTRTVLENYTENITVVIGEDSSANEIQQKTYFTPTSSDK